MILGGAGIRLMIAMGADPVLCNAGDSLRSWSDLVIPRPAQQARMLANLSYLGQMAQPQRAVRRCLRGEHSGTINFARVELGMRVALKMKSGNLTKACAVLIALCCLLPMAVLGAILFLDAPV